MYTNLCEQVFTQTTRSKVKLRRIMVTTGLLFALGLSGCSSAASPSILTTEKVDIKDIVLTNLSADCADYSASYQASVKDLKLSTDFVSKFDVSDDESSCSVSANDIPNYDFNDSKAHFADPVATQTISLKIPRNPKVAGTSTELNLLSYNAVMLNGVVLDLISNGCYKPSDASADKDGNVANGCGLWTDWRLDPMGKVSFGTDEHNGHTQPGGLYHYHGNPNALFDPKETNQGSPVIGFAADGFPIYGPHYIDAKTGKMVEAKSGWTLKQGSRPASTSSPGGTYDGTYIQDYEFTNAGTLDKCNGMTINGQYGYHVTSTYPYVMGCYSGSPDWSFFKFWDIARWAIAGIVTIIVIASTGIVLLVRRRRRKLHQKHLSSSRLFA
jgi:YHYH protein